MRHWNFAFFCLLLAAGCFTAHAQAVTGGNLRYSIAVTKFENEANWSGQWDLGNAWGAILTDSLMATGKFIVLGEKDMRAEAMAEQDLGASGRMASGNKTPAIGQMTPAQLLVKGAITHVENDKGEGGGGIGFKGFHIGGNGGKAEINVTIYVVDSRTGQVKASKSVIGQAGRKGLNIGYHGSQFGGLTGDLAGFEKDNLGKATTDAVNQAVEFMIAQLPSIPWEGTVVLVKDDKVYINRGTREGVAVGQIFTVGKSEDVVDPDTGEVLDRSITKAGTITVSSVKEKVAICTITEGAGKIAKGMGVQP